VFFENLSKTLSDYSSSARQGGLEENLEKYFGDTHRRAGRQPVPSKIQPLTDVRGFGFDFCIFTPLARV